MGFIIKYKNLLAKSKNKINFPKIFEVKGTTKN